MDAAEALLQAVRVPGQVVVHHQVRDLEVHAFAGGVGGDEHDDLGVLPELLLRPEAVLTAGATMHLDDVGGVP